METSIEQRKFRFKNRKSSADAILLFLRLMETLKMEKHYSHILVMQNYSVQFCTKSFHKRQECIIFEPLGKIIIR